MSSNSDVSSFIYSQLSSIEVNVAKLQYKNIQYCIVIKRRVRWGEQEGMLASFKIMFF